jgi:hypothetical protein
MMQEIHVNLKPTANALPLQPIPFILMFGGDRGLPLLLQSMRSIRQACARDMLQRVRASGQFDPIIVAGDDPDWLATLNDLNVTIDLDQSDEAFHFGRRLAELIERNHFERLLYMGAAAAPLMTIDQLTEIAEAIRSQERVIISNNIYSSDWAAISPASIVGSWIDRLDADNALGWVLSHDAGLKPIAWPASPATRLDIDVPIDAQIAVLHPDCGPSLRAAVKALDWNNDRLFRAREIMRVPATRVILAGRVPSWAWAQMEKSTQCWVRVYSEERGMRAAGRQKAGQVRSILNDHLNAVGLKLFIDELSDLADAILWDDRVLWAARGLWPSEIDRYASDLGLVDQITDPFVREFTAAIIDSPIPIVTGGHTLVSGGLWTILETMHSL